MRDEWFEILSASAADRLGRMSWTLFQRFDSLKETLACLEDARSNPLHLALIFRAVKVEVRESDVKESKFPQGAKRAC